MGSLKISEEGNGEWPTGYRLEMQSPWPLTRRELTQEGWRQIEGQAMMRGSAGCVVCVTAVSFVVDAKLCNWLQPRASRDSPTTAPRQHWQCQWQLP